jgi:DNA-directed RNA polymerase subunit RPC12/RpoP
MLLSESDVVVHYNGARFDIPILNKEFLIHGFSPPAPFKQVDLYKVARSRFRFTSNKLDWIAQSLGIGQKIRHKGFELWIECMKNKPEAWKQMEEYNIQDIVLLEGVYNHFLPWINNHPSFGAYIKGDNLVCTNCGSDNIYFRGWAVAKTYRYRRAQCNECGKWLRSNKTDTERGKESLIGVS